MQIKAEEISRINIGHHVHKNDLQPGPFNLTSLVGEIRQSLTAKRTAAVSQKNKQDRHSLRQCLKTFARVREELIEGWQCGRIHGAEPQRGVDRLRF